MCDNDYNDSVDGITKVLCANCRKLSEYSVYTRRASKEVKGVTYRYIEKYALCDNCNEELYIYGMNDFNISSFDTEYRSKLDIVTIEQIKKIMEDNQLSGYEMSLMLDFKDGTIDNYLKG